MNLNFTEHEPVDILTNSHTHRCNSDMGPSTIPSAISSVCFWWLAEFCASLTWPLSRSISLCMCEQSAIDYHTLVTSPR